MIICPQCKAKLEDREKVCPQCRCKLPQTSSRRSLVCLAIVAVSLVCLSAFAWSVWKEGQPSTPVTASPASSVSVSVQSFVSKKSASPSTDSWETASAHLKSLILQSLSGEDPRFFIDENAMMVTFTYPISYSRALELYKTDSDARNEILEYKRLISETGRSSMEYLAVCGHSDKLFIQKVNSTDGKTLLISKGNNLTFDAFS